jgi:hypothetical protein
MLLQLTRPTASSKEFRLLGGRKFVADDCLSMRDCKLCWHGCILAVMSHVLIRIRPGDDWRSFKETGFSPILYPVNSSKLLPASKDFGN